MRKILYKTSIKYIPKTYRTVMCESIPAASIPPGSLRSKRKRERERLGGGGDKRKRKRETGEEGRETPGI